jgi:hypothetical protein
MPCYTMTKTLERLPDQKRIVPILGKIFVFTSNDQQVYTNGSDQVQVSDQYDNS